MIRKPQDQHWNVDKEIRADADFERLQGDLPVRCDNMLDIGSGYARMPIRIADYVNTSNLPPGRVFLMDGDQNIARPDKSRTGYRTQVAGAWADGREGLARMQLYVARVPAEFVLADPQWQSPVPLDLVTSFRSWGHHYPIGTYLHMVCNSMRAGAVLIADIRKRTNGVAELQAAGFQVISENLELSSFKCVRLAFRYK